MGIFDRLFKKEPPKPVHRQLEDIIKQPPPPMPKKHKSAKDIATEKGDPYVAIVSMDIDPENIHQGSFELDWNEKFVSNLIRAGYMIKRDDTDAEIIDRWFQNVCRHVVMETWEQEQAINPTRYIHSKDIGNGRQEVS